MRRDRLSWLRQGLVGLALGLVSLVSCNVFRDLQDCERDADCSLGSRCNAAGKFCEPDRGPVSVGVMVPITGPLPIGQDLVDVMTFAVDNVNAEGGVLGRSLRLEVRDDQASEEEATRIVPGLLELRVPAIIGPVRSAQVLAAAPLAQAAETLLITPYAGASSLAESQPAVDRWLFQTITSVRRGSAQAIALWAKTGPEGRGCKDMIIVHSADTTGQDYADAITDLLPTHAGGCVRKRVSTQAAQKESYAAEVEAVLALSPRPTCGTLIALPTTGARFLHQFKQAIAGKPEWNDFYWMGTSSLRSKAFLDESKLYSTNPAEGVFGADVDYEPATAEFKKFREAYNEARGVDGAASIPIAAPNAFDAVLLVALAIEHAKGIADRKKIRDSLTEVANDGPGKTAFGPTEYRLARDAIRRGERVNYQGASSRVQFDSRGVVTNGTVIWKAQTGAFTTLARYDEERMQAAAAVPLGQGACP